MDYEAAFKKYGFICHYVPELVDGKPFINFHTHGLSESFQHPDIQFVLPLDPNILLSITHDIVNRIIKKGSLIIDHSDDIIENFNVSFLNTFESEREVIRIIFPDPNGLLPDSNNCDSFYKEQISV